MKAIGKALGRLLTGASALYRAYPARANALIAAGVVAGLGAIGVSVDVASVKEIVGIEIPILLAGEATHHLVTPAKR